MTTLREAAEKALIALDDAIKRNRTGWMQDAAAKDLLAALQAQPQQEPPTPLRVSVSAARIQSLSKALGHPKTLAVVEGDTVEDALIEVAVNRLTVEAQPPEPQYKDALNRAAYALFQIKRMAPEAIVEFAKAEHEAACKVLDGEPPEPPKECKTENEKRAFAFGWWKALEAKREQGPPKDVGGGGALGPGTMSGGNK